MHMAAASGSDDDTAPQAAGDPPHPADAVYADGPATEEIEVAAEAPEPSVEDVVRAAADTGDPDAAERALPDDGTAGAPEPPDPVEAAAPDEVIREPEDVEPDTADDETGEARRVDAEGRTEPLADEEHRPSPKAALVYNPIKVDADSLRDMVSRLSAEAGWSEPLFYETTVDDLGDDVTRQALAEGVTAVLVAGGDGTVRAVSEAMVGSGVPLTIVPSGTGNLLARNLLLPLDGPEDMVRATFEGDREDIDVGFARLRRPEGKIDEHAFVVMGGMGLDAAMIANTNPQLKKSVGWVAYVDGAARSLVSARSFRIMYELPGHRLHSTRVQSVLFANCGSLPAGLELIPEASVSDGLIDVVIVQPKGPLGWLLVWRRVAWDNSVLRRFRAGRRILALRTRDSAVRYARGRGIEIGASDPRPVQLDGDEFGEAVHVAVRVAAGGLRIAIPSGHSIERPASADSGAKRKTPAAASVTP
jgi:diacylglycerol kinase family enzyme